MIPEKIKIGYKEYTVEQCDEKLNSGDQLMGQINYDSQTISLRKTNTEEQNRPCPLPEKDRCLSFSDEEKQMLRTRKPRNFFRGFR